MAGRTVESNAGNLSGRWTGQPAEQVRATKAKDGDVTVYLSADWDDVEPLVPPNFKNIKVRALARAPHRSVLLGGYEVRCWWGACRA